MWTLEDVWMNVWDRRQQSEYTDKLDYKLYNMRIQFTYEISADVSLRHTTLTEESVDWAAMIRVDQESFMMRRMIITKTW